MVEIDAVFLQKLNETAKKYKVEVVFIGSNSVAVKGDAREWGPTAVIRFPIGTSVEIAGAIATKIINEVPNLTRILMEL